MPLFDKPFEEQMHLDHALPGTPIFFRHHGADEAVSRDLMIERLGENVLFGTIHPVLAIELFRYRRCRIRGSAAARA